MTDTFVMVKPNYRHWFDDAELEPCPRCKQHAAITPPNSGAVVCIECGFVGFRAAGHVREDVEGATERRPAA